MSSQEAVRRIRLPARLTGWAGMVGLAALMVVVAGVVALTVVALRGAPPPANQAQEAHQIATTLRCPICADLSVADSPAPLAAQMRQQISQELTAGKTPDQIRANFVASYGDTVLLSPPHQGIGQIVYVVPFVVVAAGLLAAVLFLRNGRRATPARGKPRTRQADLSVADQDRLADALARLREEEP